MSIFATIAGLINFILMLLIFLMPLLLPLLILEIKYRKDSAIIQTDNEMRSRGLFYFLFNKNKYIWLNSAIALILVYLGYRYELTNGCEEMGCLMIGVILAPFILSFITIAFIIIAKLVTSILKFNRPDQNPILSKNIPTFVEDSKVDSSKTKYKILIGTIIVLICVYIIGMNYEAKSMAYKITADFSSSGAQRNYLANVIFRDNDLVIANEKYTVFEGGGCKENCDYVYECGNGLNNEWIGNNEACKIDDYVSLSKKEIEEKIKSGEYKPLDSCSKGDLCYEIINYN